MVNPLEMSETVLWLSGYWFIDAQDNNLAIEKIPSQQSTAVLVEIIDVSKQVYLGLQTESNKSGLKLMILRKVNIPFAKMLKIDVPLLR